MIKFFKRLKKRAKKKIEIIKHRLNQLKSRYEKNKEILKEKQIRKESERNLSKTIKKRNSKLHFLWRLKKLKLPIFIDFLKWVFIDKFYYHKKKALWGIYLFVANPGEGKTLSMVKHIEEALERDSTLKIYTNFSYARETGKIQCWQDIVRAEKNSIIAIDEVHLTFESTDFMNFPTEILSQLSLNRKLRKQFICSTQRYERVNKNFRDLANYVVLCKNVFKSDRLFNRYYFKKDDYDKQFEGKKSRATYVRPFVATDKLYSKYNTLELIDTLSEEIEIEEKNHDLLQTIDNMLLFTSNLTQKEFKFVSGIRDRVKKEVAKNALKIEKKRILNEIEVYDRNLKKELEIILLNS